MDSIVRISSSFSEPWVAWTLLLMLLMLLAANYFQAHLVRASFANLLSGKDRDSMFDASNLELRGQVLIHLYKLSVVALTVYLLCAPEERFSFVALLQIMVVVLIVFVGKWVLASFLSFIYFNHHMLTAGLHAYSQLLTCVTVVMYPILLVGLLIPGTKLVGLIGVGLVGCLFGLVACLKAWKMFTSTPLSILYALIYLVTMELVPLVGIVAFCNAKLI